MTPEQKEIEKLKSQLQMYKESSQAGWEIASLLVKKLLVAEKKYLPQFVYPNEKDSAFHHSAVVDINDSPSR